MADTPNGETVTPGDSQTTVTTTAAPVAPAPVANAVDQAEVERLRKEAEQKELRIRQLENEAVARKKQDEETEAKKLEEQNQFKELFEQEKAKREALEQEQQTKEQQAELEKAKSETLAEFSEDVKKAADKLGITLLDTDESSVAAYKEKLSVLVGTVAETKQTTPNNPKAPSTNVELTTDQLRATLDDDNAFHDLVTKRFPGIASMTSPKQ